MTNKKKRQPAPGRRPSAESMERARRAIEHIARREGTTPELVRKHIQVSMLNGLVSDDPEIRAEWARVPSSGEVPTPEELIAYLAERVGGSASD